MKDPYKNIFASWRDSSTPPTKDEIGEVIKDLAMDACLSMEDVISVESGRILELRVFVAVGEL